MFYYHHYKFLLFLLSLCGPTSSTLVYELYSNTINYSADSVSHLGDMDLIKLLSHK
jgi:hypothetical protein